ncbi:MAG: tRNA (guanosine(46)-N7)-methyltransferase TrmB [Gordonia sp. (in: high G+C Gram-positive bacteria)]|uniref:tRNA (guanosine(46)-N7)-methyltransferase TrmB n=1 Tax=Gordonia sp. (in: high G+C Gram-positive bacteria) TaxID=84139 RepID=UPI0039E70BF8
MSSDAPAGGSTDVDRSRLYPRVTSFRFRRGTLTAGQQRNWEQLWPTLGRDLRIGPDRGEEPPLNAGEWFGRTAPLIIEVGSGTGISTAAMAAEEPDTNVVAVEVYQPGLAQLLGLVDRGGLTNVRMVRGDATVVLTELVGSESLDAVRVFFPDPWPKKRHNKRRFLQSGTIELIADRLKPGGVLHIATDHADYAEWIAELLATQDPGKPHVIPLTYPSPILLERPTTKFEGRAEREGRDVNEFVYVRPRQDSGKTVAAHRPEAGENDTVRPRQDSSDEETAS